MSNRNIESMDEKYAKLGKIYHAVAFDRVSVESLDEYLEVSGILSDEEVAMNAEDKKLIEIFYKQNKFRIKDIEEMLNSCEYSHYIDASGNVVKNEKVSGDV